MVMGPLNRVWQPELVADQSRTPCLDGVVVRHGVNGPDLVVVDEVAGEVDGAIGEAVRAGFERSILLEDIRSRKSLAPDASLTVNCTHASYRSRTSGMSEWPMFLFWMTT